MFCLQAKAFDAVAKAEESAKEKTTDSLNAHTAIKAAEIRASEAESRALEALSKATDATEKSTKLQARIDSVREEANAVEVAAAKVRANSLPPNTQIPNHHPITDRSPPTSTGGCRIETRRRGREGLVRPVSYTHLTLPTIYSV